MRQICARTRARLALCVVAASACCGFALGCAVTDATPTADVAADPVEASTESAPGDASVGPSLADGRVAITEIAGAPAPQSDALTASAPDVGPTCAPPEPPLATASPGAVAASTRNRLRWKRAAPLANDLARALGVDQPCRTPADLSSRLKSGTSFSQLAYACDPPIGSEFAGAGSFATSALELHRHALGGYNIFDNLVGPEDGPAATTMVATERIVMVACLTAVDGAAADTTPLFDASLDLTLDTGAVTATDLDAVVTSLYRRLLARDPLEAERQVVLTLAVDDAGAPISVRDFAVLTCHILATSSEFLFF